MNKVFRLALVGGGLVAAVAAHAVVINFSWHGTYTPGASVAATNGAFVDQTVFNLVAGSVPITSVYYTYTEGGALTAGNGWLWTDGSIASPVNAATASFQFSFTGNNTSDGMNGVILSLTGLNSFLGVQQTGQLSHTDHAFPNDPFMNTAGGQFSSVPEPASMVAIGVGLIGLIRRRATALK